MSDLNGRADDEVRRLLSGIYDQDQRRLIASMATIQQIIERDDIAERSFVIRPFRPGDIGWVLERHGALYSAEYNFDDQFEALVARIVADYASHHDPKVESAWLAEVTGERAGCIFCMRKTKRVAQLRLLLVEPRARRMGVGTKLVEECVEFARRVGYREITLWTKDVLHDARRIYERFGFVLEDEDEPGRAGEARGQTWRLEL